MLYEVITRSIIPNTVPESSAGATAVPGALSSGTVHTHTQEPPEGGTTNATQNLTSTSSLEYAVTQAKSHKLATSIIAVLLIGAIAVASYFAFFSGADEQIESIAVMP